MTEYQRAQKGDAFRTPEGVIARVFRAGRSAPWADIVVVTDDFDSWSKRMPLGIPAAWQRLPRR